MSFGRKNGFQVKPKLPKGALVPEKKVAGDDGQQTEKKSEVFEIFAGAVGQKMIKKSEILDKILPLIESKSEKLSAFYQKLLDELLLEFSLEDKLDRIIKGAGRDEFFELMKKHYYKKTLARDDNTSSWSQKHGVDWQTIIKSITALEEKDPNTSLGKPGFASAWFNFLATYERENLPNLKFVIKKLTQLYSKKISDVLTGLEIQSIDPNVIPYVKILAAFLSEHKYSTFSQIQFTQFRYGSISGSALLSYLHTRSIKFDQFAKLHLPQRYLDIFLENYKPNHGRNKRKKFQI